MRALVAALLLALSLVVLLQQGVSASCAGPPPIEVALRQADSVFVGLVRDVANHDRLAQVEVREIWRGPDLPRIVQVQGGPDDPNMITSTDRIYATGTTYLFVLAGRAVDGRLRDNGCTATTTWRDELAVLRPVDPRPPIGAADTPERELIPLPMLGLGVGLVLVALVSAVAFRATGQRPRSR
jgi:hypothetical protein